MISLFPLIYFVFASLSYNKSRCGPFDSEKCNFTPNKHVTCFPGLKNCEDLVCAKDILDPCRPKHSVGWLFDILLTCDYEIFIDESTCLPCNPNQNPVIAYLSDVYTRLEKNIWDKHILSYILRKFYYWTKKEQFCINFYPTGCEKKYFNFEKFLECLKSEAHRNPEGARLFLRMLQLFRLKILRERKCKIKCHKHEPCDPEHIKHMVIDCNSLHKILDERKKPCCSTQKSSKQRVYLTDYAYFVLRLTIEELICYVEKCVSICLSQDTVTYTAVNLKTCRSNPNCQNPINVLIYVSKCEQGKEPEIFHCNRSPVDENESNGNQNGSNGGQNGDQSQPNGQ